MIVCVCVCVCVVHILNVECNSNPSMVRVVIPLPSRPRPVRSRLARLVSLVHCQRRARNESGDGEEDASDDGSDGGKAGKHVRRTWDKEHYAQLAREKAKALLEGDDGDLLDPEDKVIYQEVGPQRRVSCALLGAVRAVRVVRHHRPSVRVLVCLRGSRRHQRIYHVCLDQNERSYRRATSASGWRHG